jgi:hypothetical protein
VQTKSHEAIKAANHRKGPAVYGRNPTGHKGPYPPHYHPAQGPAAHRESLEGLIGVSAPSMGGGEGGATLGCACWIHEARHPDA